MELILYFSSEEFKKNARSRMPLEAEYRLGPIVGNITIEPWSLDCGFATFLIKGVDLPVNLDAECIDTDMDTTKPRWRFINDARAVENCLMKRKMETMQSVIFDPSDFGRALVKSSSTLCARFFFKEKGISKPIILTIEAISMTKKQATFKIADLPNTGEYTVNLDRGLSNSLRWISSFKWAPPPLKEKPFLRKT